MKNSFRITIVSFLTYFILSAMLAPIGIISGPMADHFDQSVSDATRQFAWLTGGNLIGAIIALFVFEYISLKKLFVFTYGMIALALISFRAVEDLNTVGYILAIVGFGSGIGLAGAAVTRFDACNHRRLLQYRGIFNVMDSCLYSGTVSRLEPYISATWNRQCIDLWTGDLFKLPSGKACSNNRIDRALAN